MDEFRQGKIDSSIALFDEALALDARLEPYLWQRCVACTHAFALCVGRTDGWMDD